MQTYVPTHPLLASAALTPIRVLRVHYLRLRRYLRISPPSRPPLLFVLVPLPVSAAIVVLPQFRAFIQLLGAFAPHARRTSLLDLSTLHILCIFLTRERFPAVFPADTRFSCSTYRTAFLTSLSFLISNHNHLQKLAKVRFQPKSLTEF